MTVLALLLPDLLKNNYTLPDNSNVYSNLTGFRNSLNQFRTSFNDIEVLRHSHLQILLALYCCLFQKDTTAMQIIEEVSAFVNATLRKPSTVNEGSILEFVSGIKPALIKAATFAVKDYFDVWVT